MCSFSLFHLRNPHSLFDMLTSHGVLILCSLGSHCLKAASWPAEKRCPMAYLWCRCCKNHLRRAMLEVSPIHDSKQIRSICLFCQVPGWVSLFTGLGGGYVQGLLQRQRMCYCKVCFYQINVETFEVQNPSATPSCTTRHWVAGCHFCHCQMWPSHVTWHRMYHFCATAARRDGRHHHQDASPAKVWKPILAAEPRFVWISFRNTCESLYVVFWCDKSKIGGGLIQVSSSLGNMLFIGTK